MAEDGYNSEDILNAFEKQDYGFVYSSARPFADSGLADAQCMVGVLYQMGAGVEQDGPKAVYWFTQAANQEHPVAWNNLGTIYLDGLPGVPADRTKALHCYKKAHALGFAVMDLNQFSEA